ncbi:zinc ABC transporter substrate-binding protein [Peptoniphilus equinus]|uniref:Zinc ABC transporter substrate-binding protein n=1 Tax=Peptoniphilus equinus TaxID=3016343 RepID=A0ABY7QSB6_9FIRM|nr:zinc ABC transporter substrate-binding protein [Peptoniphilus equinus]WBW49684.1 zinc ABC transporter substrate-binding protein [Peptoniphilus equinus]
MKKKLALLVILALVLVACGQKNQAGADAEPNDADKPVVYASVYPVYDLAKQIGGERIEVRSIIPNGQEPHGWEPDSGLIKDLSEADVLLYAGAGLESWIDKVMESVENDALVTQELAEGMNLLPNTHHHDHDGEAAEADHNHDAEATEANHNHNAEATEADHNHNAEVAEADHNHNAEVAEANHNHNAEATEAHEHDHDHGEFDPHFWLSPVRMKTAANNVAKALIAADPDGKADYEANLSATLEKLDTLNEKYQTELDGVTNKTIVVSHEAYGYLSDEYGLQQIGITGIEAETEPDAKTIKDLINGIKAENIKTIFTEDLIDTKVAETISSETGAELVVLNPLESLSDEEVQNGADYFSVMEDNLKKLVEALA